ncbi:MAG: ribosome biogenesis GTPase Der [Acidobacteriota bacterium]
MPLPVVAIVGAPNAGKSTLFNRLLGRRRAIVAARPGVTRDRIAGECDIIGARFILLDTGGVLGGQWGDDLGRQVSREALRAAAEADLVLLLVDARAGLTAGDLELARRLRSAGRPVIPVANKIDAVGQEGLEIDLYRLGLGEVVPISAEHGRGIDGLLERIRDALPRREVGEGAAGVPVAIIGRPNVGKSSLFNRIAGQDRAMVSASPGTTRDPVDATFERSGAPFRIIDTAGIRRRAGAGDEVEWVSVMKARRAIREAQVVIAMVDAVEGVGHQDRALLGGIGRAHTPVVLAVNKVDRLPEGSGEISRRLREIRESLRFAPHVPVVGLSATTGLGVEGLLEIVMELRRESTRRFGTAELNTALRGIVVERPPPSDRGREVRLYYMTQVGTAPQRFVIFTNGRPVAASYRRFLAAALRRRLGLRSTSPVLAFRRRPSR